MYTVRSLRKCAWKGADTSNTAALTVTWRSLDIFVVQTGFFAPMPWVKTLFFFSLWYYVQEFVLGSCVCKECVPSVPVARLIDLSGFGDLFGHVKDTSSVNIQEIISLGGSFMCNYATVCGGRMVLEILVSDWYENWKSLYSDSATMLLVPLMCWYYRDTSLLTRVQPSHRSTAS